jgi:phage recombination protein Bet
VSSSKQVTGREQGGNKPPAKAPPQRHSLIERFGATYLISPERVLAVLRSTAFNVKRGDPPATDEELIQLLVVANLYNLNPFTKEIYAFRNTRTGGIVPIIGVDGWIRIVEGQPKYEGEETRFGWDDTQGPDGQPLGFFCEVTMHRSDRKFPITRRQYHRENVRQTDAWQQMPTRMLAHRAYIQTARTAFGLGGIHDPDEGEVIAYGMGVDVIRPHTAKIAAPQATREYAQPEETLATEDQIIQVKEALSKTGVPDNLVLARFEVGDFLELRSHTIPDVLKFIADNSA